MPTATQQPAAKPKYLRLVEQLRQQIESGALQPGDRLPSYAELRTRYGMTQPTVDRAHALLEQENLIERIQGRGTFVAERRQAGTSSSTVVADSRTVVAVVQPDQSFFDRAVQLLSGHLQDANLDLVCRVIAPDSTPSLVPPPGHQPLGFIVFRHDLSPLARQLQDAGCRVVLVGAPPADVTPEVPCVYGDGERGGYLVTRHLLDLGHRHILFVGGATLQQTLRWRGDQRAIREAQRRKKVQATYLSLDEVSAWQQDPTLAAAYFRRPDAPTGIVAWNDHEAAMLLAVLTRAGVKVPDEVSLVGYDNLPEGERVHPTLTTVDGAIGQQLQAALNLLTRPVPPPPSHTVVVTPTLVCRESSAPAPELLARTSG